MSQRVRFAANRVLEQRRAASAARDRRLRDAVIILAWTVERAGNALRDAVNSDGRITAPERPRSVAPGSMEQGDGLRGRAA